LFASSERAFWVEALLTTVIAMAPPATTASAAIEPLIKRLALNIATSKPRLSCWYEG
jgi:hypothetical protein